MGIHRCPWGPSRALAFLGFPGDAPLPPSTSWIPTKQWLQFLGSTQLVLEGHLGGNPWSFRVIIREVPIHQYALLILWVGIVFGLGPRLMPN